MKKFFIMLFIVLCVTPLTACSSGRSLDAIADGLTTYRMDIALDAGAKAMSVTQTVDYVNNYDTALSEIYFHLYPNCFRQNATSSVVSLSSVAKAYPNGASYGDIQITRTKLNGQDITPAYEGNDFELLCVKLPNKLLPSQSTEIYFEYKVAIPNVLHRFGYGDHTINCGNFYPIASVFADDEWDKSGYHCNGDPFYSEMANYCVRITCDQQYTIASTGAQTASTTGDTNTYDIVAQAVRDFAYVASACFETKSARTNNTTVYYYYFADSDPDTSLRCAVDSIETFSDIFMSYPYTTYSVVEADFIHGGMEYPNLSMISTDVSDHDDYLYVIVHETAHQWWYQLVGNDEYTYPWLDESLTEFSTMLFFDENDAYGMSKKDMLSAGYENYLFFQSIYREVVRDFDTSIDRPVDAFDTDPEYTYLVYVKGTLMYDSLWQVIGKSKFMRALSLYAENFAFSNATPDDLISCFEQTANTDLKNFFDSWLSGKVVIN